MVSVFVSHTIEYYHSSISATFSVIKIVTYLKIKKLAHGELSYYQQKINSYLKL